MLHARERPSSINASKRPFESTEALCADNTKIVYLRKKGVSEEEILEKNKKKKKEIKK